MDRGESRPGSGVGGEMKGVFDAAETSDKKTKPTKQKRTTNWKNVTLHATSGVTKEPADGAESKNIQPQIEIAKQPVVPEMIGRLRRLGERTLNVVFETKDLLAAESRERPVFAEEIVALDNAAEDVEGAVGELNEAEILPAVNALNAGGSGDLGRMPEDLTSQEPRPAETMTEQEKSSNWSADVRLRAGHLAGEMKNRLHLADGESRRPATAAEVGVVAALLGGAIGVLLVSGWSERRDFKKRSKKLEAKIKNQEQTLESQENSIADLQQEINVKNGSDIRRSVQREANEVVVVAHKQAENIREATRELGQISGMEAANQAVLKPEITRPQKTDNQESQKEQSAEEPGVRVVKKVASPASVGGGGTGRGVVIEVLKNTLPASLLTGVQVVKKQISSLPNEQLGLIHGVLLVIALVGLIFVATVVIH